METAPAPLGTRDAPASSLQAAFQQFRMQRQAELRRRQRLAVAVQPDRTSAAHKEALRRKFVERALAYIGVPYAKRYHGPGSPQCNSPLFLDCCALVRRVVSDLQEDFGFTLGRWNQAYQFDTLPRVLQLEELQPGDLVFYSGSYYNPRAKRQHHDMVHVEIFLGGDTGEATVGARLQHGTIQVFPSYRFESKNYHSIVHHFRSIDTWLEGQCRSHCAQHAWLDARPLNWRPGDKSVFAGAEEEAAEEEEEGGGNEGEEVRAAGEAGVRPPPSSTASAAAGGSCVCCAGDEASPANCGGGRAGARSATPPAPPAPPLSFYVSRGNNWRVVARALAARGWSQLPFGCACSAAFAVKWVEKRGDIDYAALRPRGQVANHIANNDVITTKHGLAAALEAHAGRTGEHTSFFPPSFSLQDAAHRFRLHAALRGAREGDWWVVKPLAQNQGAGVRVAPSARALLRLLCEEAGGEGSGQSGEECGSGSSGGDSVDAACTLPPLPALPLLVQRYVRHPLLLHGRKFDLRAYLLVARVAPAVVLCRPGYARLSCERYSDAADEAGNRHMHLTNAAVQRTHPRYAERAADTIWSMQRLAQHVAACPELRASAVTAMQRSNSSSSSGEGSSSSSGSDSGSSGDSSSDSGSSGEGSSSSSGSDSGSSGDSSSDSGDFVGAFLRWFDRQLHRIASHVWRAAQPLLSPRAGCFDLLGLDLMLDADLTPWLLEVNTNPALHTPSACPALCQLVPELVADSLDLVLRVHGIDQPPCVAEQAARASTAGSRLAGAPALARFSMVAMEAEGARGGS